MFRGLVAALRTATSQTTRLPPTTSRSLVRQQWGQAMGYSSKAGSMLAQLGGRASFNPAQAVRLRLQHGNILTKNRLSASPRSMPQRRAFHSSKARRSQTATAEPQSLSARLKKLSREYGWTAVGVYFSLSILDFPFCFALVRVVGTDRIAEIEHKVVSFGAKAIPTSVKEFWHEYREALRKSESENLGSNEISSEVSMAGWDVKEAEQHNQTEASLATQLALAYAIHKSFIFVRVPLTAAILPKVVKVLRSWGWQIGKRRPKP